MRDEHPNEQLKIELLSQWKLEAESRKYSQLSRGEREMYFLFSSFKKRKRKPLNILNDFAFFTQPCITLW